MGDYSMPELLVPRFSIDKERSYDSLERGDVKPVKINRKFASLKYMLCGLGLSLGTENTISVLLRKRYTEALTRLELAYPFRILSVVEIFQYCYSRIIACSLQ